MENTTLTVEYADRVRFHDQVLQVDSARIFIPTQQRWSAGAEIQIEIRFGSGSPPLRASAQIVGQRLRAAPGQRQGIWIKFSQAQIDVLRNLAVLKEVDASSITSRSNQRYPAALPILIEKPFRKLFRTRDISTGGICINDILPVPVGQTVRMKVEFPSDTVTLYGRVAWRTEQRRETGIDFRFQKQETRYQIEQEVRRMGEETALASRFKAPILVVDDDPTTRTAFEQCLSHKKYATLVACTGPEALSIARAKPPALILLNALVSGMNGVEVCRALKRDIGTSQIPVIFTSTPPSTNNDTLLENSGALAVLPTPFNSQMLLQLVETVLEDSQHLHTSSGASIHSEQRDGGRFPMFEKCSYQSVTLRLESHVREISSHGAFLISYWGEPIGTQGKLTLPHLIEAPIELKTTVVHSSGWGIATDDAPQVLPGLGLRIDPGADQQAFVEWILQHQNSMKGKPTVLVVDDDRSHLKILALSLQRIGVAPICLDSPFGVLNAVAMAKPALIVLDFMMPGLDGATLCRTLKGNPRYGDVPIWLYSSVGEDNLKRLAKECGADGYLRKGERPTEIAKGVQIFLEKNRAKLNTP